MIFVQVSELWLIYRELDHAMLRRLEKRILVDLPTTKARKAMFNLHLPKVVIPKEGGLELLTELDYDLLAKVCPFYILYRESHILAITSLDF